MKIEETKIKNFSLQFVSQAEANMILKPLVDSHDEQLAKVGHALIHRLDSKYAHDEIKLTTVVYDTEIPGLVKGLLLAQVKADETVAKPHVKSLLKRFFD